MNYIIAALIGAAGVTCMISRKSLLGFLIGIQLLNLGAALIFVLSGILAGPSIEGHMVGFFLAIVSMGQLVAGLAIAVRLFYQRNQASMNELQTLKQ